MAANGHLASGSWTVSRGREQEFVARLTEFLEWARKDVPGRPQFGARLGACRALCDDFRGSSYTLAAEVREQA